MSTMNTFREFARSAAGRVAEARRRRQTRLAVEELSPHLRKDIGWPYAMSGRRSRGGYWE